MLTLDLLNENLQACISVLLTSNSPPHWFLWSASTAKEISKRETPGLQPSVALGPQRINWVLLQRIHKGLLWCDSNLFFLSMLAHQGHSVNWCMGWEAESQTPQRGAHPNPQNLWICCLKWQRGLSKCVWSYGPGDGEIILDYSGGLNLIKTKETFLAVVRERHDDEKRWHKKDLNCHCWVCRWNKGPWAKECASG